LPLPALAAQHRHDRRLGVAAVLAAATELCVEPLVGAWAMPALPTVISVPPLMLNMPS